MERKITDLPDETLLKIMGYLSTHDILRNVSQVSKRFYNLSKDQHLFRKIEMDCRNLPCSILKPQSSKLVLSPTKHGWPSWTLINNGWTRRQQAAAKILETRGFFAMATDPEKKYFGDFFDVFKRSLWLKFASFKFGWNFDGPGRQICNALTSISHQFLEEFHLQTGAGGSKEFLDCLGQNIMKYLRQCPNLRKIKFEFTVVPNLGMLLDIISSGKLDNVEELHLNAFDMSMHCGHIGPGCRGFIGCLRLENVFKKMTENMPKLRCLSLTLWLDRVSDYAEIRQEMASEKNFKIEIINPKDPNVSVEM